MIADGGLKRDWMVVVAGFRSRRHPFSSPRRRYTLKSPSRKRDGNCIKIQFGKFPNPSWQTIYSYDLTFVVIHDAARLVVVTFPVEMVILLAGVRHQSLIVSTHPTRGCVMHVLTAHLPMSGSFGHPMQRGSRRNIIRPCYNWEFQSWLSLSSEWL
jgi:hypothetical protein